MDVGSLAELLHETSVRHGSFEAVAPPHDWWDWYAAYIDARDRGRTGRGLRHRRTLHGRRQARGRCLDGEVETAKRRSGNHIAIARNDRSACGNGVQGPSTRRPAHLRAGDTPL
jgi:hypothetical protein